MSYSCELLFLETSHYRFEKAHPHLLTINTSMNSLCHFFPNQKLFFSLLRNDIFPNWSVDPSPSQPLTRGLPSFCTSGSPPLLAFWSPSNLSIFCDLKFANCSSTTPRSIRCDHMTIFNDTSPNTVCIFHDSELQHCRDVESSWLSPNDVALACTATFQCSKSLNSTSFKKLVVFVSESPSLKFPLDQTLFCEL